MLPFNNINGKNFYFFFFFSTWRMTANGSEWINQIITLTSDVRHKKLTSLWRSIMMMEARRLWQNWTERHMRCETRRRVSLCDESLHINLTIDITILLWLMWTVKCDLVWSAARRLDRRLHVSGWQWHFQA